MKALLSIWEAYCSALAQKKANSYVMPAATTPPNTTSKTSETSHRLEALGR